MSEMLQDVNTLKTQNEELTKDNKKYQKINKELRAKKNGIKAVTASDKPDKTPGENKPRGRPKGQKATKNKRPVNITRTEVIDGTTCPQCKNPLSSTITDEYDRVVQIITTITEYVKFDIKRRWCSKCKKQVQQPISNVRPHARRSTNHSATTVTLNMKGLSHAKTAEFSKDVMQVEISPSAAYRDKISHAKAQKPKHDEIKQKILNKSELGCDEFDWPGANKKHACGLIALGDDCCLIEITDNKTISTLKKFLPKYNGLVRHDSNPSWGHIGVQHQMCLSHQLRLPKKDIQYVNPKGAVLRFLNTLVQIFKQFFKADEIDDPHTRQVASYCLDSQLRQLMNNDWTKEKDWDGDKEGIINRFKKRWRREGYHMSTFLHIKGIPPDNNDVERTNRVFVSIKNDGGGNRTSRGMEANSILFTLLATGKISGESFFDMLCKGYKPG